MTLTTRVRKINDEQRRETRARVAKGVRHG